MRSIAIPILLAAVAGCVVPPTLGVNRLAHGSRASLPHEAAARIQQGLARIDVLLILGEPDLVLALGRRFVYAFSVTTGGGGAPERDWTRFLCIDFDPRGAVLGVEETEFIEAETADGVTWE